MKNKLTGDAKKAYEARVAADKKVAETLAAKAKKDSSAYDKAVGVGSEAPKGKPGGDTAGDDSPAQEASKGE